MLKKLLILAALGGWVTGAQAVVLDFTFNPGDRGTVPDGDLTGWSDSRVVSGVEHVIGSMTVSLQIQGGWNGDLYGYISHGGDTVVLLNRVGKDAGNPLGYADTGLDVTFMDSAATDIHKYQTVSYTLDSQGALMGNWKPDGRNVNPLLVQGTEAQSGLSKFNGKNANGAWTLFLADFCAGGAGEAKVVSWSLQVQPVPEPIHVALGIFGGLFGVVNLWRSRWFRAYRQRAAGKA